MTTRINLLPWREERRKQLQQEFFAMLGLAALLGAAVIFGLYHLKQNQIQDQRMRNTLVEKNVAELEEDIKEIKRLEERREELVERMKVIQDLQGNRPSIVYVFDQLVRTIPDGVYYTAISRDGAMFEIEGVAESNNRISRLMRNLDESVWFQNPNLQNVTAVQQGGQENEFTLTVRQGTPRDEEDEGGDES